jgi:ribosomal protein S6
MPCYQLIVFAKPDAAPERLTELFRSVARVVYREQGQFRYMENFGVRPLATAVRKAGTKYEEVRWVQCLYDCSPNILSTLESVVKSDRDVLQFKHLRYEGYLGEWRGKTSSEKRPRFAAMNVNASLFDIKALEERAVAAAAAQMR